MTLIYRIECDWGRDTTFGHPLADITSMVESFTFSTGMASAYQEVAPPAVCTITLVDPDGDWLPDKGGAYTSLIAPGVLVRIKMTASPPGLTQQMFIGKLDAAEMRINRYHDAAAAYRVRLTVRDPMLDLLDAEYFPKLLTAVRTDQALASVFETAVISYPYPGLVIGAGALGSDRLHMGVGTHFDAGRTTLAFVGDSDDRGRGVSAQGAVRSIVAAEAGGRFYWDPRSGLGEFRFTNRHRDSSSPLSAVFNDERLIGAEPRSLDDTANAITVTYSPRRVGAPNTPIYTMPNVPVRIRAGEERTFTARYTTGAGVKVGALTVIPPQAGTDYAAVYEAEDGTTADTLALRTGSQMPTGSDATGALSVTAEIGGGSAKITLRSTGERDLLVTRFQLRGTPLETFERASAAAADAGSIAACGRRERIVQVDLVDDGELAEGIARHIVARFAQPLSRMETVSYIAAGTTLELLALTTPPGQRIRVTDAWSGHDSQYIVVGERHEVSARELQHRVTYILKPADRENLFVIGAAALNGVAVLAL